MHLAMNGFFCIFCEILINILVLVYLQHHIIYCIIIIIIFFSWTEIVRNSCIQTFVQPKPLAMGYLYAELEVRPMVCGLPPWYDPLEEKNHQKPFGYLDHREYFLTIKLSSWTKCHILNELIEYNMNMHSHREFFLIFFSQSLNHPFYNLVYSNCVPCLCLIKGSFLS